jgi:hypothetical protein
MIEREPSQFLSDDERAAQIVHRRAIIADVLQSQAQLLIQFGVTDDAVQGAVDSMRDDLQTQPAEQIAKINKALTKAVRLLDGLTAAPGVGEHAGEAPELSETPATLDAETTADDPEAETEEVEAEIDDRKPKSLSPLLNNMFKRVFTYEQRAALDFLDDEQKAELVASLKDLLNERASSRLKKHTDMHTDRFKLLLDGLSVDQIAEQLGTHSSTITAPFRKILPEFLHQNKHAIVGEYSRILAMNPGALESAEHAVQAATQAATDTQEPQAQKQKREKIEHPEGLSDNVDNALRGTLSFEQRAAIPAFDEAQMAALVSLFESTYAKSSKKPEAKDLWTDRFGKFLNGGDVREMADGEGVHTLSIITGFNKFLPGVIAASKEEFVEEFEKIRTMPGETQTADTQQPESAATTFSESAPLHDEPLANSLSPEPAGATEQVAAESNESPAEVEQLVATMQKIYRTDDPEALKAVADLFSVNGGVAIESSEQTAAAAEYLAGVISRKGISLEMTVASPVTRAVIWRMLGGISAPDGRKYSTLSEILADTPDSDMRRKKQEGVEKALEKIARLIGEDSGQTTASSVSHEDLHAAQIAKILDRLPRVIDITREQVQLVIERMTEKNEEVTPELHPALLEILRIGSGVGLDEQESRILRAFTRPRPNGAPMSVEEIREMLREEQRRTPTFAGKNLENGYVTTTLLRSLDKIIVQRSDG